MKKVLFASTALVAAVAITGAASAAEPLKLSVGGFAKALIGFADQDADEQAATAGALNPADFDVKNMHEIHFRAATTLDNGMKVSFVTEFEGAGGGTGVGGNSVDQAAATLESAFGKLEIGLIDNAAYRMHVAAPNATGTHGETETDVRNWFVAPAGFIGGIHHRSTNPGNFQDPEIVSYFTPNFGGFSGAVSYIPTLTTDVNGVEADNAAWSASAGYAGKLGGAAVKGSLGYFSSDDIAVAGAATERREWAAGLQVGFGGFTVGGSYKDISQENTAGVKLGSDGRVWDAGVLYATGPYAVSVSYLNAEAEDTAGGNDDEYSFLLLSGKYTMGPGVAWTVDLAQVEYEEETAGVTTNSNDGWVIQTGFALGF